MKPGHDSFLGHLRELRTRLLVAIAAILVATFASWPLAGGILDFLLAPVLKFLPPNESLKFFGLPDAFTLNLKVSLWAGLIFSAPITLYQAWAFCAPGLLPTERKRVPLMAFFALILFFLGVGFAYFLVWPSLFGFFLAFQTPTIQPVLAGDRYLSLVMGLTLVFALAFQMPLVLMFLGRLGIITADTLKKRRPYAIIGFFVLGAILTPPDAVSQCFLAVTLLILYEISVFLLPKARAEDAEDEDLGDDAATKDLKEDALLDNLDANPDVDNLDASPEPPNAALLEPKETGPSAEGLTESLPMVNPKLIAPEVSQPSPLPPENPLPNPEADLNPLTQPLKTPKEP